jgi:hypothetical protein
MTFDEFTGSLLLLGATIHKRKDYIENSIPGYKWELGDLRIYGHPMREYADVYVSFQEFMSKRGKTKSKYECRDTGFHIIIKNLVEYLDNNPQ